jgi:hypothetical protein
MGGESRFYAPCRLKILSCKASRLAIESAFEAFGHRMRFLSDSEGFMPGQ